MFITIITKYPLYTNMPINKLLLKLAYSCLLGYDRATMAYLYLASALLLNAIANILLKVGASRQMSTEGSLFAILASYWPVGLGIVLFALNVVLYFLALRSLPISLAYPVMVVGGFLLINSYAVFFLKEEISTTQIVGYLCIVAGVLLVVSATKG